MKRHLTMLLLLVAALAVDRFFAAEPPPDKIVRVSFVEGDASYQRGDAEDWNALGVNTPLMTGDSLYTPREGRAEVSLGRGSFARLGDGTQLDLTSLTPDITQLGVSSGRLSLRVRSVPQGAVFEVDTPSATATIRAPGLYRIAVDERRAMYEVVSGGMSVVLGGEQLDVGPNESLAIEDSDPPTYEYSGRQPAGGFDDWVSARDQRFERAESTRYVHQDVEGQEDLDAHGSWRPDPTYGRVWVPAGVSPDWAPYQSGRWVWQDPYGWTWVSYEDWGWAPYHYGRWVNTGGTWAWVPPPPVGYVAPARVIMPEPVYAPALVAFVGGSNWHIGVSLGGGSAVGWVPLAPAERYYYPWQPAPTTVVHYTNVKVVNAVTVVNQTTFVNGGNQRVRVRPEDCTRAPVMGYSPRGIAPTPESLNAYPHRRLREGSAPVRAGQRRPLVARLVPPPRPVPFKEKVAVIRKTGRPVAKPVAFEGDVGKPFQKGTHAPAGVSAVSALSPERPAKLRARGEETARAPRRIERDLLPVQERPGIRPSTLRTPGTGGPVERTKPGWQRGKNAAEPAAASVGGDHGGAVKPAEGEATVPGDEPEPSKTAPTRAWPAGKPAETATSPGKRDRRGAREADDSGTIASDSAPEQPKAAPVRTWPRGRKPGAPATSPGGGDRRNARESADSGPSTSGAAPEQPKAPSQNAQPPARPAQPAAKAGDSQHQEQARESKGKKIDDTDKKKKKSAPADKKGGKGN